MDSRLARTTVFASMSLFALALAACTKNEPEMLRDRAAERLACPADSVRIARQASSRGPHADDREYAAQGCGLAVAYRCVDSMDQVATRDRLTGSDVRSQTRCEAISLVEP